MEEIELNRVSPCDVCGSNRVMVEHHKKERDKGDHITLEEVYNERCASCGNLLYGYSKPAG